jgi:hypothetical protein
MASITDATTKSPTADVGSHFFTTGSVVRSDAVFRAIRVVIPSETRSEAYSGYSRR